MNKKKSDSMYYAEVQAGVSDIAINNLKITQHAKDRCKQRNIHVDELHLNKPQNKVVMSGNTVVTVYRSDQPRKALPNNNPVEYVTSVKVKEQQVGLMIGADGHRLKSLSELVPGIAVNFDHQNSTCKAKGQSQEGCKFLKLLMLKMLAIRNDRVAPFGVLDLQGHVVTPLQSFEFEKQLRHKVSIMQYEGKLYAVGWTKDINQVLPAIAESLGLPQPDMLPDGLYAQEAKKRQLYKSLKMPGVPVEKIIYTASVPVHQYCFKMVIGSGGQRIKQIMTLVQGSNVRYDEIHKKFEIKSPSQHGALFLKDYLTCLTAESQTKLTSMVALKCILTDQQVLDIEQRFEVKVLQYNKNCYIFGQKARQANNYVEDQQQPKVID